MLILRSLAVLALLSPLLAFSARAQSVADVMLRLDRMESENRRLNGEVEQLGNQVRRLEDQLQRFQKDVDFRFKDGEGNKGGENRKRSDAAPATTPDAPKTIGQLAAEVSRTPAETGPGSPASLAPGAQPKGSVPPSDNSPKGAYQTASALLDRGEYEAAEMAFRDFLKSNGKDRLAADAVFGLGESYYRRNRYREAAEQFLSVTTEHPKSSRAPEAMLKLGMSLRGLGATPEACGTYSEVTKKYPKASQALRQAVAREKKRARCAA